MPEVAFKDRMTGSLLARNTMYNLLGQAAPIVVALFSVPLLIKELGTDRFGLLSIIWMIIGYFSLFDFGIGRALTQLVSTRLGEDRQQGMVPLVWTAMVLLIVFGLVGTVLLEILSPWLVDLLQVPLSLQGETKDSIKYLALSIPIVISATALRGILEAYQRFDLVNGVRIPMGILTFIGPVAILPFSHQLPDVVLVLLIVRVCLWVLNFIFCVRVMPNFLHEMKLDRKAVKPLITFGGWMTVSNVVSPLMTSLDRFIIGYFLTMTAVAYYTTPYDMITKLFLVPTAILGVLFPTFSLYYGREPEKVRHYYHKGLIWNYLLLFPILLVIVFFAKSGLALWISPEFAEEGYRTLQILSIGVLLNGLSNVPYAFLQGIGRPDVTAKVHMVELTFYFIILWFFTKTFGIEGAAWAWCLRVTIDLLVLYRISLSFLQGGTKKINRWLGWITPSVVGLGIPLLGVKPMINMTIVILSFLYYLFLFFYKPWESIPKAS